MTNINTNIKLEHSTSLKLDFKKLVELNHLGVDILPVIVQNAISEDVLLLAYTNKEAIEQSLKKQQAIFWSTSRKKLWIKGESSGDYLDLVEIRVNCEQNSLLYRVIPRTGSVCHVKNKVGKGYDSCFYRQLQKENIEDLKFLK